MSTETLVAPLTKSPTTSRSYIRLLIVVLAWWALYGFFIGVPNKPQGFATPQFIPETDNIFLGLSIIVTALAVGSFFLQPNKVFNTFQRCALWLIAIAILIGIWEASTDKYALLPPPFFAPPRALVEAYASDWPRMLDSLLNSVRLLFFGFVYGSIVGFITGVSIGWSKALGYWVHPVLRFLGPVPSTALLPLSMFLFPTSFSAAIFLIALATWFPVTVLTWSGISSVDHRFYDVARTLGAKTPFLILRVAIPASLPHVFVGLFMGLGASFSVLVSAEMLGVKSGLGWYLQWAQGWAAYSNMYAVLIIMALLFSSLITLLFVVRDRILAWQSNEVKW